MGNEPEIFSAAIFKNQIPSCCFTADVVDATRKLFKDEVIDCIQPINGLYRFDFLSKEAKLKFITKGLKIVGKTIPAMDWSEGLDSPRVRVVIGGLPRETPDSLIMEALSKLGVEFKSPLEHDYYRDKETGNLLKIKSGRRAVMINKPSSPLPKILKIGDREASIRHWGQNDPKNYGNTMTAKITSTDKSKPPFPIQENENTTTASVISSAPLFDAFNNSQSLFSQSQVTQVIPPSTVPVADIFNFKAPIAKSKQAAKERKQSRGRSRTRSVNKRALLKDDRLESPHKLIKSQTPLSPESYLDQSDSSDQEGDPDVP